MPYPVRLGVKQAGLSDMNKTSIKGRPARIRRGKFTAGAVMRGILVGTEMEPLF